MSTKATIRKVKWDKVDKDWYQVIVTEGTEQLLQNIHNTDTIDNELIIKLCNLMTTAVITTSQAKPVFEAKPKLKVWSQQIKQALHAATELGKNKEHGVYQGNQMIKLTIPYWKKGSKKVSKTGNKNRNSNTKK